MWFKKNIAVIVLMPTIVGSHLAWGALQNDTRFVSEAEKKGQPIFIIAEKVWAYLTNKSDSSSDSSNKTFYQQLRSSERQSLVGPPESMRDRCVNKKMNTKVWDLFYEADRVREMLTKFIKEESLRTYLFTYSNVYTSISIPSLIEMFELTKSKVQLISKMIINGELMASLDDPTETVVMHRSEPSRLQALSMQLADKVTNLVDANERIFELKQGNMFQGQRGDRGNYRNQNNQQGNLNNNRNRDNHHNRNNRNHRMRDHRDDD